MKKIEVLICLSILLVSCATAERYNAVTNRDIPPEELHQDIDKVKKNLFAHHPDIDMYLTKEQISHKLDSLKKTVKKPMKSADFSRELFKVVSKFGHGHIYLTSRPYKMTKVERHHTKGSKGPLSQLSVEGAGDRLMLKKITGKKSSQDVYAELISIDDIKYKDYYNLYKGTRPGDGYIKTMDSYIISKNYLNYVSRVLGVQDAIILTLKKNGSVYTKVVKREFLEHKNAKSKQAPAPQKQKIVKKTPVKYPTREEIIKRNALEKYQNKVKKYLGYNPATKQYSREISFPVKGDSSIAVLKIRDFKRGSVKKGYAFIFDSLHKHKVQYLILDLRGNGGGYVRHGNTLYSYLSKDSHPVIMDSAKVMSKTAMAGLNFTKFNAFQHTVFLPLTLAFSTSEYFNTQKGKDGSYYYKMMNKSDHKAKPLNKYAGKLYVLTNGATYSMSAVLAASLQAEGRATFIGEETGGDFNGTVAGHSRCTKLRNSLTNFCFGVMTIKPNAQRKLIGRGVLPDIPVPASLEDLMMKKDPALSRAINEIRLP